MDWFGIEHSLVQCGLTLLDSYRRALVFAPGSEECLRLFSSIVPAASRYEDAAKKSGKCQNQKGNCMDYVIGQV